MVLSADEEVDTAEADLEVTGEVGVDTEEDEVLDLGEAQIIGAEDTCLKRTSVNRTIMIMVKHCPIG